LLSRCGDSPTAVASGLDPHRASIGTSGGRPRTGGKAGESRMFERNLLGGAEEPPGAQRAERGGAACVS
jgi:hypothetical protein